MGLTRTDLFSDTQNELASIAKVMGHPARIAILQHLLKTRACVNGDLVKELGLAQATISQHLRELKSIDIIQGTIEGTSVCYCINPATWTKINSLFGALFASYSNNDQCC